MKFKDHDYAHQLLDNLAGIEIGGSAHNSFNLPNCKNIDYSDNMHTIFKIEEEKMCGEKMPVDIVAEGDDLPLEDNSVDYCISSHVLEHFPDPILALKEWLRVVRPGGYVFSIVPKQNALPTETRPCTQLQELLDRHEGRMKPEDVVMEDGSRGTPDNRGHWSVWNLEDFLPVCEHFGWNVIYTEETDSKCGNGWTVVIQK